MSLWCPCDVLIVMCLCCLWLSQSSSVSEWRFHDAVYTVHICTHYEMATSSFFVRHLAVEKPLAAAMHELQKYRATGLLNPASHPLPWNFPCDILWQQRMNRHHGTTYRTSYETPMECSGQRGDKDWSLEETLWKNCCHISPPSATKFRLFRLCYAFGLHDDMNWHDMADMVLCDTTSLCACQVARIASVLNSSVHLLSSLVWILEVCWSL